MSTSLPTPPRTIHRDKENQPPTPVTPSHPTVRTPRIVWSQDNLHHAYTTHIRQLPSSNSIKAPRKSILKKPHPPFMPPIASPQRATREVTPEPVDPLQHPLYLNSPVITIVSSLSTDLNAKISLTDLTEAYSVLSARLKTKTQAILDITGPIAALEPLYENSAQLAQAFRRDIGRALVDPQGPSAPASEESALSTPSSVGSVKKRGFTEQEVKYARDLCNLCHAALRCFSNMSVVPALYSIFSDEQLSEILTDILAIPLATTLPTPNARKTWQLSIWTLQSQRLPTAVLSPATSRIAYSIRRGIEGELGREGKQGAASDGLKAVGALISRQPAIFMAPFAEILPSVFANLTSQNATLRVEAAHALLSFSRAIIHTETRPPAVLQSLSQATVTYMAAQHEGRKSPEHLSPIGKAVKICFESETPGHAYQSPMWALSVITSLIVLSGADTLTQNRIIKFIMDHLQTALSFKRTTVRAAGGLVWRVLLWACLQLDKSDQSDEKKESGWKVVRQVVDGGIGISLVAALLGVEQIRSRRISQALQVINAMIKKGSKTCEEGVNVLAQILSGVGQSLEKDDTKRWEEHTLLAEPLLDGTFLRSEINNLPTHVKSGLNKSAAILDILPLHEDEVIQYWDVLFVIWTEAIKRAPLGMHGDVPVPLLQAWRSLLLTQSQLNQGCEAVVSEPSFIAQVRSLLGSFLTDKSLDWSLEPGAPSWANQEMKLGFVYKLWITVREVFSTSVLSKTASSLLDQLLRQQYTRNQAAVREAWVRLCSELLLVVPQESFESFWERARKDLSNDVECHLWNTVSSLYMRQGGSHIRAIQILSIPFLPFTAWELCQATLDTWKEMVKAAVDVANGRRISSSTVIDSITTQISGSKDRKRLLQAIPSLLHGINTTEVHRSPNRLPSRLFQTTSDLLLAAYASNDAEEQASGLILLRSLTRSINVIKQDQIVDALIALQDGLCPWIEDDAKVTADEQYNNEIIPLYALSLEILRGVTPSFEILNDLVPFLASAFNRIPSPGLGPTAFKNFWTTAYRTFDFVKHPYPEDLKPILRTVQELLCEPEEVFAPGLSQLMETQLPETDDVLLSIVPDSLLEDETNSSEGNPHEDSVVLNEEQSVIDELNTAISNDLTGDIDESQKSSLHPQPPTSVTPTSPSQRNSPSKRKRGGSFTGPANEESRNETDVESRKRRRPSVTPKQEAVEGWQTMSQADMFAMGSEDSNVQTTTPRTSDVSIPSSRPGKISASRIISPLPRRFHSETYDPPSDDSFSSSPLKDIAARRQLKRAKTAPAEPSSPAVDSPRRKLRRVPSEEYLAIEQAHAVVTTGASQMELQELLKASRMANSISMALNAQMAKRLVSSSSSAQSEAGPPAL
ncbi:hypothetical protein M422DRAFT_32865 [Sphaerobolus stellatus SS14]|uniref:Telomere-associated protein Rif1 N-terminal domain-containing protein n=1 Tax=Sphaerobolus stellatus (strain SS14) TaxID=990650 RepID=A0A0C9VMT4_SPHS4|nr:hypothetical protein M422DRAFT_32865 [Sphaerobolus stellatus SS14]